MFQSKTSKKMREKYVGHVTSSDGHIYASCTRHVRYRYAWYSAALLVTLVAGFLVGCASTSGAHTALPHMSGCASSGASPTTQAQLAQVVCHALTPLASHIARVVTTYDA